MPKKKGKFTNKKKVDLREGIIAKSTGSWYDVRTETETIRCRIQGKFRLKGWRLTNPVAVGDKVEFYIENEVENTGIIKNILPRSNYMVRMSPHKAHYLHLLGANLDQVLVFVTIKEPNLKPGFIDRFLLMTEPFDIPTYIIVNKADLYSEDDLELFGGLQYLYEEIGYKVLLVSALEKTGIDELKAILKDKTTLISGHSGVGKSTLVNAIQPDLDLRTLEISDFSGKGQHTTTFAEMYPLNFGGYLIDTPGIKSLAFNHLEPMDVAHNFKEFFEASHDCKFSNCFHINEPKCAVKAAIEEGTISELRYMNYLQIMGEIEEQNYWERLKGVNG